MFKALFLFPANYICAGQFHHSEAVVACTPSTYHILFVPFRTPDKRFSATSKPPSFWGSDPLHASKVPGGVASSTSRSSGDRTSVGVSSIAPEPHRGVRSEPRPVHSSGGRLANSLAASSDPGSLDLAVAAMVETDTKWREKNTCVFSLSPLNIRTLQSKCCLGNKPFFRSFNRSGHSAGSFR